MRAGTGERERHIFMIQEDEARVLAVASLMLSMQILCSEDECRLRPVANEPYRFRSLSSSLAARVANSRGCEWARLATRRRRRLDARLRPVVREKKVCCQAGRRTAH